MSVFWLIVFLVVFAFIGIVALCVGYVAITELATMFVDWVRDTFRWLKKRGK